MRFNPLALLLATSVAALDPNCAPGGNFDLSKWKLQEPDGDDDKPNEVPGSKLKGCNGFQDKWFYTDKTDGALVMKVPKRSECVTTPNSKHCRSELREADPDSWDPHSSTNRLFGDVKVVKSGGDIVVGQIHMPSEVSTKPVALLYAGKDGKLTLGVGKCRTCTSTRSDVGKLKSPHDRFTYEIRYEKNKLSVSINGGEFKEFDTYDLDGPKSYFKAGNYNQAEDPSEVHFYQIKITH